MRKEVKKPSYKPKLIPTLDALESIQQSFDKARKEISKQKDFKKEDFKSV